MSEHPTGRQPRPGHRRSPVVIQHGAEAEINALDWQTERALRIELEDVKRRLTNVTRRLQRQLGTAEFGTIGGRRVVQRVELVTGGTYAPVNHRTLLEQLGPGPVA